MLHQTNYNMFQNNPLAFDSDNEIVRSLESASGYLLSTIKWPTRFLLRETANSCDGIREFAALVRSLLFHLLCTVAYRSVTLQEHKLEGQTLKFLWHHKIRLLLGMLWKSLGWHPSNASTLAWKELPAIYNRNPISLMHRNCLSSPSSHVGCAANAPQ